MQLVGSFQALVATDFYHSIGDHIEKQHHAPEDFDFDDVATEIAAKANTTTVNALTTTVAAKATQAELDALTTTVAAKATQAGLDALTVTVGTKADQTDLDLAETAISGIESFKDDTEDFFNYTDRVIRDNVTNAMIVQNLRVLSTTTSTNVAGQTYADPEVPGLFFADGTCTEALKLIDDARVEFASNVPTPRRTTGRY